MFFTLGYALLVRNGIIGYSIVGQVLAIILDILLILFVVSIV